MMRDLENELQKIGLSEKEAKVYLAGLELGSATAQQLAAKATVQRPSAYVAIESLIKRGLMSSFEKGKKKYFHSGNPGQLTYFIESKKRALEEEMEIATKIVSQLGDPSEKVDFFVEMFEGVESVSAVQNLMAQTKGDEIMELTRIEEVRKFIPVREKKNQSDIRHNLINKFKRVRSIHCQKEKPRFQESDKIEYRYLPSDQFPFRSDLHVFGDDVVFWEFDEVPRTIHIRSKKIANSMRIIYETLWLRGIE